MRKSLAQPKLRPVPLVARRANSGDSHPRHALLVLLIDFFANGCILTDQMPVDRGDDLLLILQPQDYRKASQALCAA